MQHSVSRDICTKFVIPNLPQSSDIGQNLDVVITYFQISGQTLINENCHKSRTINDIDMKLRPVTKLEKRTLKVINDDVIVIFPV